MRFFRVFPFLCLLMLLPARMPGSQSRPAATPAPRPSAADVEDAARRATADGIVHQAIDNDELRRQHRLALECDQTITTERLDETGKVFKTKTVRVIHRESREFAYSADVDATSESTGKDGDTAKAQHLMAVMNLRKLAPRFLYSVGGEGEVRGRTCWIIEYAPKGEQTANTREEKVINHLHGRYWIDQKTFEILQGEGSLVSAVPVALIASVTRMDFRFHSQTLPNGEAGPSDFTVDLTVRAPLYFYRQKQTNRLENWRAR